MAILSPSPGHIFSALLLLGGNLAAFAGTKAPERPNEIIVSSANYAQTPADILDRLFRKRPELTEVPPPAVHAERPVRYYQFLPGETLEADLSYADVCKLLSPALKAKHFINTADQAKVDFILRVTFGGRRWRDAFVREDYLEWNQGLVPKKARTALGADQAWDDRAGGDESALYQLERDTGVEGLADRLIGGLPTEDYYLIVVDAFAVAQLKQLGNKTPRAWSTFIAVPRQKGVKFADVAAKMIEKAAPWFGETLPGQARFTDREGTVKLHELQLLETSPRSTPK